MRGGRADRNDSYSFEAGQEPLGEREPALSGRKVPPRFQERRL
jgi:hypothetical protein